MKLVTIITLIMSFMANATSLTSCEMKIVHIVNEQIEQQGLAVDENILGDEGAYVKNLGDGIFEIILPITINTLTSELWTWEVSIDAACTNIFPIRID